MALIKCPECGKEISNKATACIHCGFPIATANTIAKLTIKAQSRPAGFTMKQLTMDIVSNSGKKLCTLEPGQVISIDIANDIEIYAIPTYGLSMAKERRKSNTLKISSQKSTRVQVAFLISFGALSSRVVLNEVDMIDSE